MKRKLLILTLTAILLMCVCALTGCAGKTTVIDLKEYVNVSFTGLNGSGTAQVSIDTDAIYPLVKDRSIADNLTAAEIENNGNISNGDTIKVRVTYNEKMMSNAKIEVKNAELSFPVSGLKEKEKLDVFADISIETSGISPECLVNIRYGGKEPDGDISNLDPYKDVKFDNEKAMFELKTESGEVIKETYVYIEKLDYGYGYFNKHLKDGETVTIQLSDNKLAELSKEYLIIETSCQYTVKSKQNSE